MDDIKEEYKRIVRSGIDSVRKKDNNLKINKEALNKILNAKMNNDYLKSVKFHSKIDNKKNVTLSSTHHPFNAILRSYFFQEFNSKKVRQLYDDNLLIILEETFEIERDQAKDLLVHLKHSVTSDIAIYSNEIINKIKSLFGDTNFDIEKLNNSQKKILGIKESTYYTDNNVLNEEWLKIWDLSKNKDANKNMCLKKELRRIWKI